MSKQTMFDDKGNIIFFSKYNDYWYKKKYENELLISYEDHRGNWWDINYFPETSCPYI